MLIDLIMKRKSTRKYKLDSIPESLLRSVIEAARFAPSGCNAQPWLYFIAGRDKIKMLKSANVFAQDFVYNAPCLVVCCGNPEAYNSQEECFRQEKGGILPEGAFDKIKEFFYKRERERTIRDVSVASSYLVLRATEIGLGTCYVGWFDELLLKKTLNLPESYVVPFVISVGYPDENPVQTSRKNLNDIMIGREKVKWKK